MDRNDAPPVFRQTKYEIEIGEVSTLNTQIYVLHATDEDSDKNGEISYDIVSAEPAKAFSYFEIGFPWSFAMSFWETTPTFFSFASEKKISKLNFSQDPLTFASQVSSYRLNLTS